MEVQLDLFGEEYTAWDALWLQLEADEEITRSARHIRSRFLDALAQGRTFMLPAEMGFLLREARSTFVNGEFTATILLALSFIEHWLAWRVILRQGSKKAARSGVRAVLDYLRESQEFPPFLIEHIDRLREIRNPFAHPRPGDPNRIDLVSRRSAEGDHGFMEREAQRALGLLYSVADHMPDPWPLTDRLGGESPKPWVDDPEWQVPGTLPASHYGMFSPRMFRP